jgi:adenine-specific DNA-methyltransferase
MLKMVRAGRVVKAGQGLGQLRKLADNPVFPISNVWTDTVGQNQFGGEKVYIVQTAMIAVQRCILMATDPGDLVLDPTCGSGTTATVAEQWGRRWITVDTSRVALALARTRLMAAKFPYYLLADSREGRAKEAQLTGKPALDSPAQGDLRQGFVYDRAPHVTLKSIANNAEIDVLWEEAQTTLEPLRMALNAELHEAWEEWQIPREVNATWPAEATRLHAALWQVRIARQSAIDASIAKRADIELLYDRPYEDKSRVRVAGPFTVESLSPHRVIAADEEDLADTLDAAAGKRRRGTIPPTDFATMVLDNMRTAGVHQSQKADSIHFTSLVGWPGHYIAAEGRFTEGEQERRAGILIGPEFGTLSRPDLVAAAREASEARFDVLIACAFNYDAHASELTKLGPLPILKARMNPDLHMADDLKNTGKGNLFVVFGEPDVEVRDAGDGMVQVKVLGVDVFDPQTGDIRSGGTDSIAAWFIDTLYDEESFRVRHAYFLGANDPYKSLKTALRAEIDEEAWATLYRDISRPFARPDTGRIAVKVINHFGDEVMKVFAV